MSSSEERPDTGGGWLHFAGVAGSGMSALAQFHARGAGRATGSDRAFDEGRLPELRVQLENAGIGIVPQDGSFADVDGECRALVVSTAVEDRVPDVAAARGAGIPVVHRSEYLAARVAEHRTIAVSGTSGKSTVTAMIFTILRAAGLGPGLLTGGPLADLTRQGLVGNAWAPEADGAERPWLVIEADESDGTLVRYRPWLGLVLNLGLDHKPPAEVMDMFRTFGANTAGPFVVAADENLAGLTGVDHRFGIGGGSGPGTWCGEPELSPDGADFTVDGVAFRLPVPGRHNVLNALAAIAACRLAGVEPEDMVAPLAGFGGVARRFQSLGEAGGVEVIDDFAHNPDKIAAALAAARARTGPGGGRVLALFQPHGFGPTRFLREALVASLAEELADDDILWFPEIFFAGGSVVRDISAADLAEDIRRAGRDARFAAERGVLPAAVAAEARPGDVVIVMGARDPSLTAFAGEIKAALEQRRL